ncbi:hypothetical protein [Sphingomonas sp. J315]|uniref:hypothetical protein n=1 Tax=Sphingomonas sp. J315 TaxID=2898433 RepID=UPI0021AE19EA|nr:hypothetical protein [Sphingomonas sp. J315]UUX99565.1 hypothetical protein LRS08_19440 [Sphingomonas sp. J315]
MIDAERRLVMTYAPSPGAAAALEALLALDDKLAETLRTTSEPMLGQIRVQWWHDALSRLDAAPPPPEPVLQGIARDVVRDGITGARVAEMVEGWQSLLQAELDDAALTLHGARGRTLFAIAGAVAGAAGERPAGAGGRGLGAGRSGWQAERSRRGSGGAPDGGGCTGRSLRCPLEPEWPGAGGDGASGADGACGRRAGFAATDGTGLVAPNNRAVTACCRC